MELEPRLVHFEPQRLLAARTAALRYRTLPNGRQVVDEREHDDSDHGYTSNPANAMRHEPEAVDADTQEQITSAAQHAERDRLLREWNKCRDRIVDATTHFTTIARPDQQLRSDLRVLERQLARIGTRLGD